MKHFMWILGLSLTVASYNACTGHGFESVASVRAYASLSGLAAPNCYALDGALTIPQGSYVNYWTISSGSALECTSNKRTASCLPDGRVSPTIPLGQTIYPTCKTPNNEDPELLLPKIISFSASAPEIFKPNGVTLSWSTSGADYVRLTGAPGVDMVVTNGSLTVYPQSTTTYYLTAVNIIGGESASVKVEVVDLYFAKTSKPSE